MVITKTHQLQSQTPRTLDQVKEHNTKNKTRWIIINNKIYDISKYLQNETHPGGEVIFTYAGKDATDVFQAYHPEYVAQKKLIKYQVGIISNPKPISKMVKEFREIDKYFKENGYYDTRYSYYMFKVFYAYLMLVVGVMMLLVHFHGFKCGVVNWGVENILGNNSIIVALLSGLLIALAKHQLAFFGHDTAHTGVSHNWEWDFFLASFFCTSIFGISVSWWKYTHNQHHVVTNEHDIDPDITHLPFFSINENMFLKKNGKPLNFLGKIFIKIQYILYFPILLILARISLIWQSFSLLFLNNYVLTMPWQSLHLNLKWKTLERCTFGFFLFYNFILFVYIVPRSYLIYFFIIHHLTISFLHIQLTLSHWDRPSLHSEEEDKDWVVKQIVTSRNIEGNIFNEWFYGGLHYQIEHHLFPRLPRHNLSAVKPKIVEFCKKYNIEYCSSGFWSAIFDVVSKLKFVSEKSYDKVQ